MDRRYLFDRLHLDHQPTINEQVEAKRVDKASTLELEPDRLLALDRQPVPRQTICKNCLIDVFKQARPKRAMNADRRIDHPSGQAIDV